MDVLPGGAIDTGGAEGVDVAVVVEVVVGGEGDQHPEADAQRVEDLDCGVYPDPWLQQFGHVGPQVVADALHSPRQRHSPDQQNQEHDVRQGRCHPHHFARHLDP